MDANLELLLILGAFGLGVGAIVAIVRSERVRTYGLFAALRRMFSGGGDRGDYEG